MPYKEIDKEFVEHFLSVNQTLKNMDEERRKTELDKISDFFAKQSKKEIKENLPKAIEKGLISKEEYEKEFKGKYIEKGIDGFAPVLSAMIMSEDAPFTIVTCNKLLLKDSKLIEKRFNIKVMTDKEAWKILKKLKKNNYEPKIRVPNCERNSFPIA